MIPLDAKQIEEFTPKSLLNVVPRPVFKFRAPTPRDQQRYNHQLTLEGIRLFTDVEIREEILRVVKDHWDEDTFRKQSARLETAWAMMDQKLDVSADEVSAIQELVARCMDISPMLRRMDADNKAFAEHAPAIAFGMFCVGWSNVDSPFRMEGGVIPYEALVAVAKAIRAIERKAVEDRVEGVNEGLGFLELTLKAFSLLNLDKEEEKNSSAPSPSSETPSGSNTTSPRDGASETMNSTPAKTRPAKSRSKPKS